MMELTVRHVFGVQDLIELTLHSDVSSVIPELCSQELSWSKLSYEVLVVTPPLEPC